MDRTSEEHEQHPSPFIDPFPISIWIHIKELSFIPFNNENHPENAVDDSTATFSGSCSSVYSGEAKKAIETNMASMHGLIYIPNLVTLQVTHLQLLFLMRILDSVTEFSTYLTEDTNRIQAKQESLLISAVFPLISASLIFPPTLPVNVLPMSPIDCSESLPPPTPNALSVRTFKDLIPGIVEEDAKSNHSKSSIPSLSPPNDLSPTEVNDEVDSEGRLAKSQSDGCLPIALEFPTVNTSKSGEVLNAPNRAVSPQVKRPESDRKNSSSTSSSLSSSVRRGLTSGFHSLKNTLESSVGSKLPVNDDASDTASIHSDLSNDSDTFVMLYLDNDHHDTSCAFLKSDLKVDPRAQLEDFDIETGTEALPEDPVSSSEPSEASTATKFKQYVSF